MSPNNNNFLAKTFIFDFDGTIANTFEFALLTVNQLSDKFHYRAIKAEEKDKIRNMSSREIVDYLGIPKIKIPLIAVEARKVLKARMDEVKPVDGMIEVLQQLRQKGVNLGILSSNSSQNIKFFLKRHHLDFFEIVLSYSSIWGKAQHLKRFINQENVPMEKIYYVGDETRDIKAAQKVGIKVIAVSWGYNSEDILRSKDPDFLVRNPLELLTIASKIGVREYDTE